MLPYRDSRLTRIILVAFFLLVAGYAYYESRGILAGPSIAVTGRVMEVHESFIKIEGKADRISSLSMNGNPISITEDGSFSEGFALAPGYNRITLTASDRYGKKTEKAIEVIYTPSASTTAATASSSPATATSTSTIAPKSH